MTDAAKAFLTGHGIDADKVVEIVTGPGQSYNQRTIRDIAGKLIQHGSISVPSADYLKALMAKVSGPPVIVPVGRVSIKGKVAKAEWRESRFGSVRKMLVRAEQGWAVWVTVPALWNLDQVRDKVVEFVATVKASDSDPSFGFGSRPTPIRVVA